MVKWGEKLRSSRVNPRRTVSSSIPCCNAINSWGTSVPIQITRGRSGLGKAPIPPTLISHGGKFPASSTRLFSRKPRLARDTSPRNLRVRWIFSTGTHLTGSFFPSSCNPADTSLILSSICSERSIAMKALITDMSTIMPPSRAWLTLRSRRY